MSEPDNVRRVYECSACDWRGTNFRYRFNDVVRCPECLSTLTATPQLVWRNNVYSGDLTTIVTDRASP